MRRGRRGPRVDPKSAFLNIPYDAGYQDLYLAFIAGTSAFDLKPRATLELAGSERRLDRIFELITSCRYSFHDLSRVEMDLHTPRTPRFNMPFELGLAVAWQKMRPRSHVWFVFESMNRRLQKSLSDLGGSDPYIHDGTAAGVFRELSNALVSARRQPSVRQMRVIYADLQRAAPKVQRETGAKSLFEARVFRELVLLARESAGWYEEA